MAQMALGDVLELARSGLADVLSGRPDSHFPLLAEWLDESISTNRDVGSAFAAALAEDELLEQYLRRAARAVAAEEVVPAGSESYRLVLFGVGVLAPADLNPWSDEWVAGVSTLANGLAAIWAEQTHKVTVMPVPAPLDSLYRLTPTEIRDGLLELFARGNAKAFLPFEAPPVVSGWTAFILPAVAAVRPECAKDFVSTALAPAAPTPELSALKHRFEARVSAYESTEGLRKRGPAGAVVDNKSPMMLAPLSWANVFSYVRGMHLRKDIRDLVKRHPEAAGQWTLTFDQPNLRLTNFRARISKEYWFPEETSTDIHTMVAPLAAQLAIEFHGNVH